MRENISVDAKNVVMEFRTLSDENKLYFTSVILNHISNGLINDGNYLSSDEAIENDKMVFEPSDVNLNDTMKLATNILVVASTKDGITINPNGIDIEPYINEKNKKEFKEVLSKFYNLSFVDKIDFLTEILYDVSEIKEIEELNFDFNELINSFLNYRNENFGNENTSSLDIEDN